MPMRIERKIKVNAINVKITILYHTFEEKTKEESSVCQQTSIDNTLTRTHSTRSNGPLINHREGSNWTIHTIPQFTKTIYERSLRYPLSLLRSNTKIVEYFSPRDRPWSVLVPLSKLYVKKMQNTIAHKRDARNPRKAEASGYFSSSIRKSRHITEYFSFHCHYELVIRTVTGRNYTRSRSRYTYA